MANQEHVDVLKQGVEAWNKWREEHPDIRPDLNGADLVRINLFWVRLSGDSIAVANLANVDFSNAGLAWADLTQANLTNANLSKADIGGAQLFGARLINANLSEAWLTDTNLSYTNLKGAIFTQANLRRTLFISVDLSEVQGLDNVLHNV